jgi:hypothetical protein
MNPHVFENRLHQLALTLEDLNEYWDEYQSYDFLPAENRRIEREFAHKYYIITGEIYQDGDLGGFAPDSLPNLEFWLIVPTLQLYSKMRRAPCLPWLIPTLLGDGTIKAIMDGIYLVQTV